MFQKESISPSRREIEAKLVSVGDYVKIDYLTRCLKSNLDFDTRRFVLMKLADLYEARRMFLEAGKMIISGAEINTTSVAKIADFMRSTDLFIRGGAVDQAESAFGKALAYADGIQRDRLKNQRKELYKKQAQEYVSKDRRKNAMDLYEKFISLPDLDLGEKREAQEVLLSLYDKLGKIREYGNLRRALSEPTTQSGAKARQVNEKQTQGFNRII